MSFQLNVVLEFENGGNYYDYWIQDVAGVDTANNAVEYFENNVWNFTTSGLCLSNSAVTGHGTVYSLGGCEGYYAYGVASSFTYPGTFQLIVNASVNANQQPTVRFMYDDGAGFQTYDVVTFPFVSQLDESLGFVVNSGETAPAGAGYDAEFVLGGPGNGYSTNDEGSDVQLSLQYWNGNNYQMIYNAENHGEDTAETITSTEVNAAYNTSTGDLYANVSAGTENIDQLWGSSQIAFVNLNGPGTCDGTLYSETEGTAYVGGYASITLWPVSPDFRVGCDGYIEDFGAYNLAAGTTLTLNAGQWVDFNLTESGLPSESSWSGLIGSDDQSGSGTVLIFYLPVGSYSWTLRGPSSYLPQPSAGSATVGTAGDSVPVVWQLVQATSTAKSGSVDVGQRVDFSVALTGASNDTFSWNGLPSGCASSNASSIACRPSSVSSGQVTVEVADGNGYHATSAALPFTTFADPTIGPPGGTPTSSDVGQSVTFTVVTTPGSGNDTIAWSGLPVGCPSMNSTSVTCSPSNQGDFTINVTITDSNGYSANSSGSFTVFALPTVGPVSVTPGTTILAGRSLTFTVISTPGSGGLAYVWNGLPSGCQTVDSDSLTCTPSSAGTWYVTVTITDSNHGTSTSGGITVTVQPSFLGLPALEGYGLVSALVIAIIAIGLAVGLRRRSSRDRANTNEPTIAEKVRGYSPHLGPAPVASVTISPEEAWKYGLPPDEASSTGAMDPAQENLVGLDPGSASMSTPLINPPDRVCWHCQFENPPGSRYCSKCALPLAPPPPAGSLPTE